MSFIPEQRPAVGADASVAAIMGERRGGIEFGALNSHLLFSARREGERFATTGPGHVFIGHRFATAGAEPADGAWVEWQWTPAGLRVRNDRYGLIPVYVAAGKGSFTISTSLRKIVEHTAPTDPDEDALAVFLRLGTFISCDTPFKGIRALPPGTDYLWHGQPDPPSYDRLPAPKAESWTKDEARQRYGVLFAQAIERRAVAVKDSVVALSGGMDSRHILFEMVRQARAPKFCITARAYAGESSEDVELAQAVSAAVGVPHVVVDEGERWLETEIRKNEDTHFSAFEHSWGVAVGDDLTGRAAAVFDGLAGDVFSDCRGITTESRLDAYAAGRFTALAEDFLGPETQRFRYLSRDLRSRLERQRAVQHLASECARFADAPNPAAAFWFWNRTRRTVALLPYGIWQQAVHVFVPYLDHALFDFLSGLPAALVSDYGFHAQTIHQDFPVHHQIPFFSGATRAPPHTWAGYRRANSAALAYAWQHGHSSVVSPYYLFSRLGRAMVDTRYCRSASWLPPLVVYLLQFEQLMRAPRSPMSGHRR